MDGLRDWTAAAADLLGVDAGEVDADEVVRTARDVQRAVAKPAAMVAGYLLGVAVGRGADRNQAAAQLADLAKQWPGPMCDWRD